MDKVDKIGLLREKLAQVEQGGGAEKIAKQHDAGKMTARERIQALFDENSFVEIDTFVETRSIDFDMTKKESPGRRCCNRVWFHRRTSGLCCGAGLYCNRWVFG